MEAALLADALGDPLYQTYFAGWFRTEELGDLIYLVEPAAPEAATLGRFSPLEASEKERRKIERALGRTQRKGRLIGVTVDDLGQWDTWVSAPLGAGAGKEAPRVGPFEPPSYTLDLALADRASELTGRAKVELLATRATPASSAFTSIPTSPSAAPVARAAKSCSSPRPATTCWSSWRSRRLTARASRSNWSTPAG